MDIKYIRESAYLTQNQFAKEIGVHANTVASWEKGTKKPRLSHKKALIDFCKNRNIDLGSK